MSKNIVICCDGTGNEFGNTNSNVVKLYSTLVIDANQAGYYHPGVGTMGAPGARTWFEKQWTRINGLAFGAGILDNVEDAYRYLMETYREGNRIFLFGFSRGAYTVRVLAGILQMYGLLCPGNNGLIPYVTAMFAKRSKRAAGMQQTFEIAEAFKKTFSRDVLVHFVGVWDTVSSVGWVTRPVILPYSARNPGMQIGRHAISIHERRCYFRQNLWGAPFPGQDIKQYWFTGVHSDVGGSYPDSESGLSQITLEWMLSEARDQGLHLKPFLMTNVPETQHESLADIWWILEYLPHRFIDMSSGQAETKWRIPMGRYRKIPEHSIFYGDVQRVPPNKLPSAYTIAPRVNKLF